MNKRWYESDNPDVVMRGGAPRLALWIIIALAFIGLVSAVVWGLGVVTSGIRGQGDAVQTKNSAANWVAAQERFESMWADINTTDMKLDVLADAVRANPDDRKAQIELTGTKTYCLSVVADYNASARKFNSADFRAADLPFQIDTTFPATDCKENR